MRAALALAGGVLSGCVAFWTLQGNETSRVPTFLITFGPAFAAYLLAIHASNGISSRDFKIALALAVLWRVALVVAPPLLSDDVYRYVWEGRIQLHDGNPYKWADRAEGSRWEGLRDAVWERVNHKDYTAIYPPLWQLAARGVVAVHDSVTAMKAFVVACELGMLAVLARLLALRGLPRERLLVAAWSPLALVEIAGSGHNEALGLLLVALALLALDAGHPLLSALASALAFQAKLVPGLIAASWWRRYRVVHVIAAGLLAMALVVPYAGARQGLWRSLGSYGRYWRFNETLFAPLAALLGSHAVATAVAGVAVLVVALAIGFAPVEPATAGMVVVVAWLLLAPNVLPWYALTFLPFLVLCDAPAVLLFTGTTVLAYLVYPGWLLGGPWQVGWGVRAAEYGPCAALALAQWWRRRPATA
jgi:alpha-1,6-mannosyltransferase